VELVVLDAGIDVGEQFALGAEELDVPCAADEHIASRHASTVDPVSGGVTAI
jgi:hypothetical protein